MLKTIPEKIISLLPVFSESEHTGLLLCFVAENLSASAYGHEAGGEAIIVPGK